ncbi:MAG TPA: M14 family zinc carboxypeptidase [Thermoanaerobaculia bacterium]|nr:M14 family zinc carboxypeptidase [Thermoanaerobaculia bacterium]
MGILSLPIEEILASGIAPPSGRLIGRSRQGRDIVGHVLGTGGPHVSLIGGCHSDEPVGPEMLRRLAGFLAALPADHPLLISFTWYVVPHVNPDGEAVNSAWSGHPLPAVDSRGAPDRVYDLGLYLRHVMREPPGDDMEFGFPRDEEDAGARPENRAVAAFLSEGAPFALHGSFHGMAFATGPWFLIERAWTDRTAGLRESLRRRVRDLGYRVFDVDRGGEKGFSRIDEGFTTRPDSVAMRAYFLEKGDPAMAERFRPSSMEYVRSLGGDPFTLVSEMPLFLRPLEEGESGRPDDPRFRAWLERMATLRDAEEVRAEAERQGVRGMPLRDQMRLQLAFLEEALRAVASAAASR